MSVPIPQSIENEQAVLGCILMAPDACMPICQAMFPGPEVFHDARHQHIYEVMLLQSDERKPVNLLALVDRLKQRELIEQAGGFAYMAALEDATPSTGHIDYCAGQVFDRFRLRRMLEALRAGAQLIADIEDGDVGKCIDAIEEQVLRAGDMHVSAGAEKINEPVARVMEVLDQYQRGRGLITGVRTGFGYLDKMIGGLHAGEMTVLAGRPSTGKTSLAANIIDTVAVELRLPVGLFSMEMRNDDIALRMLCTRARASFHRIRTGFMSTKDHDSIIEECKSVGSAPIHMDDQPSLDIKQLRARSRRMAQRYGVRLIVIDYLQLAQADADNEVQVITKISQGCKSIARELNLPVLVLSQLNREFDKDKKRKPQLSDLRGSGSIEQDADCVLILYRKTPRDDDEEEEQERTQIFPTNVHVAKQRNGPIGDAELLFFKEQMRFVDAYANKGSKEHKVTTTTNERENTHE